MSVICLNTFRTEQRIRLLDSRDQIPNANGSSPELPYDQDPIRERLEARFGDNKPRGGVLYQSPITVTDSTIYVDTYGRGNVHNSQWQYQPKSKDWWNRPQPFPSNWLKIKHAFETYQRFTLGLKSDPFQWMDLNYGITEATLKLACEIGTRITIETMSDLVVHEDYLAWVAQCTDLVIFNMGSGIEEQERRDSPGAPSLKRRMEAVKLLRSKGVPVRFRVRGSLVDIFALKGETT